MHVMKKNKNKAMTKYMHNVILLYVKTGPYRAWKSCTQIVG